MPPLQIGPKRHVLAKNPIFALGWINAQIIRVSSDVYHSPCSAPQIFSSFMNTSKMFDLEKKECDDYIFS